MVSRSPESVDGRVGRVVRSRQALCEAFLALVQEGNLRPGAGEIAERAGLSRRSLFHHFKDLGGLYDAAYEIGMRRAAPLMKEIPQDAPVADRVSLLVDSRCQFLEVTLPFTWELIARALVGPAQEQARKSSLENLARQNRAIEVLFADDLAHLGAAERKEVGHSLTAAISPQVWGYLRTSLGLSYQAARATVARSLRALLSDAGVALG